MVPSGLVIYMDHIYQSILPSSFDIYLQVSCQWLVLYYDTDIL